MNHQAKGKGDRQSLTLRCPNCESPQIRAKLVLDRFLYGSGDGAVELTAEIPVHHCDKCNLEFSGEDAEKRRHTAICKHRQLLQPSQIAEVRAQYSVSRSRFSEITRIGLATLARWESGEVLQNSAMDMYVRLLARPDIFELVRSGALVESRVVERTTITTVQSRFPRVERLSGFEKLKKRADRFRVDAPLAC